jgi:ATP-dependent DNA helicase RecG
MGYAVGEDAIQRATIMEQTSDGFVIAEEDLNLRGPGEFLGTRQSGLPGFKLAHLVRDIELLQQARQAAFEVLRLDPTLSQPEHQNLRVYLERKGLQFVA